jgi:hypothetical protein
VSGLSETPISVAIPPSLAITTTSVSVAAGTSDEWRPPANFSPSSTTACGTARSVASPKRDETQNGRNPVRARYESWSPLIGETAALIEPARLRPNHSMPPRRGEEMTGIRVTGMPCQHRLALETDRNASLSPRGIRTPRNP